MSDEINHQRRSLLGGALAAGTAIAGTSPLSAKAPQRSGPPAPAIDVHTHMYTRGWQEAVRKANDPHIKLTPGPNGADSMFYIVVQRGLAGERHVRLEPPAEEDG